MRAKLSDSDDAKLAELAFHHPAHAMQLGHQRVRKASTARVG
jgi:hypothetical protein